MQINSKTPAKMILKWQFCFIICDIAANSLNFNNARIWENSNFEWQVHKDDLNKGKNKTIKEDEEQSFRKQCENSL